MMCAQQAVLRNKDVILLLIFVVSCTQFTIDAWTTSVNPTRTVSPSSALSSRNSFSSSSGVPSNRRRCGSTTTSTSIFSLAPSAGQRGPNNSSGSSNKNNIQQIQDELGLGRKLEGGQVIDFSSVKASSKAEAALAKARQQVLSSSHTATSLNGSSSSAILGINDDVIEEVGHPLGGFATIQDIQNCAVWIRSLASSTNLFKPKAGISSDASTYAQDQIDSFKLILQQAFQESGEVTGAYAKTFYMGTMLLGEEARKAIWAIYVWCRRTDEIVDAPRGEDGDDAMLHDLSCWEMRLENLWEYGEVEDVYDLALLYVRVKYPNLDITPFMDMIRGMLMDVPGLGQDRYESFDELHLYCYRVAGTVGLMSLPVFGCAPGYDDDVAREPALSLGVAFQLTNILRDVGEDAVERGRVYLPQEDLRRFGVTEDQIFAQKVDENYIALMKFEIDRARSYYARARRGVFMLAPSSRLPVQSSLDAYGRILDKIEENNYDSLTKRAYVDKWEKLSIIPSSWYRTLDISRMFPLPGDKTVVLDEV